MGLFNENFNGIYKIFTQNDSSRGTPEGYKNRWANTTLLGRIFRMKFRLLALSLTSFVVLIVSPTLRFAQAAPLNGAVRIDGSSTVFPISEAVAEDFGAIHKSVRVTVGTSGTGGGFKKFCAGEIDINNASRQIRDSELELCRKNKITFIELPVAIDGLTVVVNPTNNFISKISIKDLKKIWEPNSKVKLWSDLNESWPKEKIQLFGPGPDSGTFDYFTEEVVGKAKSCRTDYTASEDDNMLIKGVAASRFSLGYFGHGYYMSNKNRVKALEIENGKGSAEPTDANIANGTYPLARRLFIYVSMQSVAKPQVDGFVNYYLESAKRLASETGYLPMSDTDYKTAGDRYAKKTTGISSPKSKPSKS
jgi:phosphate transport system substrate-binding protein